MKGVTKSDVTRAVDELKAASRDVSVAAVRAHLARGSATTITRLLREVRAEIRDAEGPKAATLIPIPNDVAVRVEQAARKVGEDIYRAISDSFAKALSDANAQLDAERQAIQRDVEQVLADAGDAADREAQANAKLRECEISKATLRAESAAKNAQLAELRERLETLDQELIEMRLQAFESVREVAEMRGRLAAFLELNVSQSAPEGSPKS